MGEKFPKRASAPGCGAGVTDGQEMRCLGSCVALLTPGKGSSDTGLMMIWQYSGGSNPSRHQAEPLQALHTFYAQENPR